MSLGIEYFLCAYCTAASELWLLSSPFSPWKRESLQEFHSVVLTGETPSQEASRFGEVGVLSVLRHTGCKSAAQMLPSCVDLVRVFIHNSPVRGHSDMQMCVCITHKHSFTIILLITINTLRLGSGYTRLCGTQ